MGSSSSLTAIINPAPATTAVDPKTKPLFTFRRDNPAAVAAPNVQSMTARMSLDISGNLVVNQNVTAYGAPSDIKLKENIEVIDNALDKVKQLKGITYDLKSDGNRLTGLIAQDLEKVLPEAVYTSKTIANEKEGEVAEEHLAIRYGNTVGLLVEAIKELEARVKELEAK